MSSRSIIAVSLNPNDVNVLNAVQAYHDRPVSGLVKHLIRNEAKRLGIVEENNNITEAYKIVNVMDNKTGDAYAPPVKGEIKVDL